MSKKIRYTLIASILITISVLLLPGSHAQRNPNLSNNEDGTVDSIPATQTPDDTTLQGTTVKPSAGEGVATTGPINVMVQLTDSPAAVIYAEVLAKSPRSRDKALLAEAGRAAKAQALRIEQQQATLSAVLSGSKFQATQLYRVHQVLNGIAIAVDASKLDELRRLPGVKSVNRMTLEYPTNSTSVPFIGAPQVWGGSLGLNVKGDGIRVGIIDTGLDYQHANFGSPYNSLGNYAANNTVVAPDFFFPTAKVVGGYDFAGDDYTGGVAHPDPDPMDCNGHGTHVAGTAAGFGVKTDGTTYTGPFTDSVNYSTLRIGPGSAPGALLYGIRVFGCFGGTNLTVQGIEWAVDPNGDGDPSDHLDVINMSLGGLFGTLADESAQASDNAVLAGVIVVTAAGNAGDTFFIQGSPGTSSRAISTAASADSGVAGPGIRVNSPPSIAGFKPAGTASFGGFPPPGGLTGNVVLATDPADAAGPLTTDGCSPLTNAAAVAGNIALIDRGTCGFAVKAKTAQDAGAIAVIIANNAAGPPPGMGGTDPTVTIPAVSVSQADGNAIKANLPSPGVNVTLFNGADTIASFSSRGSVPAFSSTSAATSVFRLKPDISAPGLSITSSQTGVTCKTQNGCTGVADPSGFQPGSQALVLQGTSMASPHVAGVMALLRQLHPDWTVEELKALVMNGAIHDVTTLPGGGGFRYGPSRIGAGRVDAPNSALSQVIAFSAGEAGVVSLSFDSLFLGDTVQTKRVRVVNNGTTPQTYDLGIDTVNDAAGVAFSLPGASSVTVPPNSSVEFDVRLTATVAAMDHTFDPTLSTSQTTVAPLVITRNRFWLTEEGGYVTFSQGGTLKLRVPIYTAPRAASNMSAPATIPTGGAPTGSTTIPLTGTHVCTGTLAAGPTCTGSFPNDEESLVSPYELQVVSGLNPTNAPGFADLQYVGVSADATRVYFGVSTWEKWSSPSDVAVNIYIDLNLDGNPDRVLFNTNTGRLDRIFGAGANQADTDSFIATVYNTSTGALTIRTLNEFDPAALDTAAFNNRVMFMGATTASLGLATPTTPFRYSIVTCPGFAPLCEFQGVDPYDVEAGPYTWGAGAKGLSFGSGILYEDLNGASIPVTWNTANYFANNSKGALLLHHHNADGRQAEVVVLQTLLGAPNADLALTYSATPTNPSFGQNTTLTLTVTNNGPDNATGVEVSAPLPPGITYVSDDGAYDPSSGIWTVGAVNNGTSKTLNIVVSVNTTDTVTLGAQITGSNPLDTNPANNQAIATVAAPRSADIALAVAASTTSANVGDSVTFTFNVTNNGDDPAFNVNTTITFPGAPGLVPTSSTATKGSYNSATGVWSIASLDKGASATLTLTVTVPQVCPALVVQATVTSQQADPNLANNTGSATVNVKEAAATFNSATYTVAEGAGHATITVIRAVGCSTGPLTVEYETSDASGLNNCDVVTGNASQRCDYTTSAGTLSFAAGQTSATFDVPVIDDVYVEGPETLTVTLFNPAGVTPGTPTTATLTITDNDASPGAPNPIDNDTFFIRQQYLDILGREPDAPGLAGWQAFLSSCASGSTACDRIELSSRFFRSAEFFDRAYFIYRFYEAGLGRKPTYAEYQDDFAKVAGFLTPAELEARKAAFAEEFSQRPEFKAKYDSKKDGDEYVNAIVATAGVTPSNRTNVAIRQGALSITRGQALRELLESPEISAKFFNEAFVVIGYFAYLRRDPDAQYLVWLNQLNTTGNYRDMIGGFIGSQEYRRRFGS